MLEKQYDYLDESYRNLVPLWKNSHKQTFLAQDNVTGKIVVKKYISAGNAELYLRLKEVRQKNLVQILQVAKKSQKALVIMEYIGGQTLEEFQKEHLNFSEEETADYIQQLLEGLGEIHKQNKYDRYKYTKTYFLKPHTFYVFSNETASKAKIRKTSSVTTSHTYMSDHS